MVAHMFLLHLCSANVGLQCTYTTSAWKLNCPYISCSTLLPFLISLRQSRFHFWLFRDPFLSPLISKDCQEVREREVTMPQFSTVFFNKVVTHVASQLQEEDVGEEYTSDLKGILARFNSSTSMASDKDETYSQPFAQLDAGVQLQEFNAAQKHLWQEILDNIKKDLDRHPYIALSMTAATTVASAALSQQRSWREGEGVPELQVDVVLFTCNHHFPRVFFQEFILPEFQQRMSELPLQLKHTIKLLLRFYGKVESCLPSACPICVYNSIRMEQVEILMEQNVHVNGESIQAKPWDI